MDCWGSTLWDSRVTIGLLSLSPLLSARGRPVWLVPGGHRRVLVSRWGRVRPGGNTGPGRSGRRRAGTGRGNRDGDNCGGVPCVRGGPGEASESAGPGRSSGPDAGARVGVVPGGIGAAGRLDARPVGLLPRPTPPRGARHGARPGVQTDAATMVPLVAGRLARRVGPLPPAVPRPAPAAAVAARRPRLPARPGLARPKDDSRGSAQD